MFNLYKNFGFSLGQSTKQLAPHLQWRAVRRLFEGKYDFRGYRELH